MGIPLMYLGFESGEVMVVVDLPLLEPSLSVERDGCRTARDLALAVLVLPEIDGGAAPVIGCAGETAMTATLFTSEQQGGTEHAFRVSLCSSSRLDVRCVPVRCQKYGSSRQKSCYRQRSPHLHPALTLRGPSRGHCVELQVGPLSISRKQWALRAHCLPALGWVARSQIESPTQWPPEGPRRVSADRSTTFENLN